jgi:RimJ/RimL family protein N-acetyltransferase
VFEEEFWHNRYAERDLAKLETSRPSESADTRTPGSRSSSTKSPTTMVFVLSATSLVTERLVLTPLTEQDADAMVEVLGDEQMHAFTGGAPLSLDEMRSRYRRLVAGQSSDGSELWFNWVVRLDAAQPVGMMQATVAADGTRADVAWEIGVPWQGHRYASEAATAVVRWLIESGITDLRALIHPEHLASARVAARAGLTPTTELVDGELVWRLQPAR